MLQLPQSRGAQLHYWLRSAIVWRFHKPNLIRIFQHTRQILWTHCEVDSSSKCISCYKAVSVQPILLHRICSPKCRWKPEYKPRKPLVFIIYRAACAVPLASYLTRSVDGSSILAALDRDIRYSICADNFVNSNGPIRIISLKYVRLRVIISEDIQAIAVIAAPAVAPPSAHRRASPGFGKVPAVSEPRAVTALGPNNLCNTSP